MINQNKDYFGNIWVKSYLENKRDYPLGTKFKNIFGSYWVLTEFGFEWPNGSTFPNVGGDWSGEVCLPIK